MHQKKLSAELSSAILTIGPEHRNHRGGVGAVIDVYSHYYEVFNYIPSHKPGSSFYKSYVFFISIFKLFGVLLSDKRIKIIHIHGASYGSFYRKFIVFIIGKYLFRKKIIYHIHGGCYHLFYKGSNFLSKRLIKNFLSHADVIICLSNSWIEFYETTFKTKRIIILPNIIDYPLTGESSGGKDLITFLFLGLICKEKGIFDLIEVIAGNKEHFRYRIKLLIGGNGEVRHLKNLIEKYHIEDMVEFLGWISSNEKANVLNSCDVYILPSYNEGLPISILESMSYGKAIISTKVGGIPEIVKDKVNGILINPGDLKQIEDALNSFLEDPELIKNYGAASLNMVQKYLPESVITELEGIYNSLLSGE